jgi:hypothetical protein
LARWRSVPYAVAVVCYCPGEVTLGEMRVGGCRAAARCVLRSLTGASSRGCVVPGRGAGSRQSTVLEGVCLWRKQYVSLPLPVVGSCNRGCQDSCAAQGGRAEGEYYSWPIILRPGQQVVQRKAAVCIGAKGVAYAECGAVVAAAVGGPCRSTGMHWDGWHSRTSV